MLKPWLWFSLACLLPILAGLTAFVFLLGLPADVTFAVWATGPKWTLSSVGNIVLSGIAGAAALVVELFLYAAIAGLWRGLGSVADIVVHALDLPIGGAGGEWDSRPGLQVVVLIVGTISLFSAWWHSGLAMVAVAIALLGSVAIRVLNALFHRLSEMQERFTLRSRTSAIGGGQAEWQISQVLALLILLLALAGGIVALGAVSLWPVPPSLPKEQARPAALVGASTEPGTAPPPARPSEN